MENKKISKNIISALLVGTMLFSAVLTGCENESKTNTSTNINNSLSLSSQEESQSAEESKDSSESETDTESEDTESEDTEESSTEESYIEERSSQENIPGYLTANIGDSGTCGENVKWEILEDGQLVISGSGNMDNYFCDDWKEGYGDNIKTIVIENGITGIGEYAFAQCVILESVTIADSVKTIGDGAFYNCRDLESAVIPDGVTAVGNYVFYECRYLKSVTVPDSVKTIGDGAFYLCENLTNVNIPKGLISIGESAFYHCSLLTDITLPDSVTTIGAEAFYYCESLENITIPDSAVNIGDFAFRKTLWYESQPYGVVYAGKTAYVYKPENDDDTPTDIVLKDGTLSIAKCAFYYCKSLKHITIPESVTNIGDFPFDKFENKMTIYGKSGSYAETYAKENDIAFSAE